MGDGGLEQGGGSFHRPDNNMIILMLIIVMQLIIHITITMKLYTALTTIHVMIMTWLLGGTQTGSYQTGSYQKGRFIPPKPKLLYFCFLIRPRLYASDFQRPPVYHGRRVGVVEEEEVVPGYSLQGGAVGGGCSGLGLYYIVK